MLVIVLLRVLAAFCAADIIDVKKPEVAPDGVVAPLSGVGVRGADVIFDSLLGPSVADPALPLLWAIMLPVGDELMVVLAGEPPALAGELLAGESLIAEWLESVGVGGVFTITGVPFSAVGGVRGGLVVSIFWPRERRRNRSVGAVFDVSGASAD